MSQINITIPGRESTRYRTTSNGCRTEGRRHISQINIAIPSREHRSVVRLEVTILLPHPLPPVFVMNIKTKELGRAIVRSV